VYIWSLSCCPATEACYVFGGLGFPPLGETSLPSSLLQKAAELVITLFISSLAYRDRKSFKDKHLDSIRDGITKVLTPFWLTFRYLSYKQALRSEVGRPAFLIPVNFCKDPIWA
jgi:hypothetical protein